MGEPSMEGMGRVLAPWCRSTSTTSRQAEASEVSNPYSFAPYARAIQWLSVSHRHVCHFAGLRSPTKCGSDRRAPVCPGLHAARIRYAYPRDQCAGPKRMPGVHIATDPPFCAQSTAFCEQVRCRCAMSRLRAVQHQPETLTQTCPHSCIGQDCCFEVRLPVDLAISQRSAWPRCEAWLCVAQQPPRSRLAGHRRL